MVEHCNCARPVAGLLCASLLLSVTSVVAAANDARPGDDPAYEQAARHSQALINLVSRGASSARLVAAAELRREHLADLAAATPESVRRLALPASVRTALPAAARVHVEEHVVVSGALRRLVTHGIDEVRVTHFIEGPSGAQAVLFDDVPANFAGGAVRLRGISLPGVGILADDRELQYLAPGAEGSGTTSGTVGEVVNPLGEQKTLVLLVNFQDSADLTPYTLADAHAAVFGTVNDFFLEASYGRAWLSGNVHGWFTLPITSTCNTTDIENAADAEAAAAGIDLSAYGRLIYVIKGTASCVWSGASDMWVYPSRAWINGNLDTKVIAHELGHGLGLYHSSFLDCGDSTLGSGCTVARDDKFDTMGAAPEPAHFNAFQKERLGWLAPDEIATVSGSGSYGLRAMELGGGVKAIKLLKDASADGATWYYLEYRQPLGFDSFIAGNDNVTSGLLVHTGADYDGSTSRLLDMTPASSFSVFSDRNDPALVVGQSYNDSAAGITITTTSANSADATVDVSFGGATCQRSNPTASMAPSQGPWVPAGTPVEFTVTLTNRDNEACGAGTFELAASVPAGWEGSLSHEALEVSAGASATTVFTVVSGATAPDGYYDAGITAVNRDAGAYQSSVVATYVVNNESANSAPAAQDDATETAVNKEVAVDVLANDFDADGDPLSVVSVVGGANGTAHVVANRVVYKPERRFSGVDQVDYVVSDGAETAMATVTIQVRKKGGGGRPRK